MQSCFVFLVNFGGGGVFIDSDLMLDFDTLNLSAEKNEELINFKSECYKEDFKLIFI